MIIIHSRSIARVPPPISIVHTSPTSIFLPPLHFCSIYTYLFGYNICIYSICIMYMYICIDPYVYYYDYNIILYYMHRPLALANIIRRTILNLFNAAHCHHILESRSAAIPMDQKNKCVHMRI